MGSDILKSWLVEEVGLKLQSVEKVSVLGGKATLEGPLDNLFPRAQDFANGVYFGQLLHHYGMQPDFDKFVDTRHPDAMVNNYTRLQVRLGVLGCKAVGGLQITEALPPCSRAFLSWASSSTPAQPTRSCVRKQGSRSASCTP